MGRGKALRSKVKEKKALTKAELQAVKEWENRTSNFSYMLKKQILKVTEKLSFDDWLAIAVGAWSASTFQSAEAFLLGAVAYKLARAPGGTPPVSQIAGLATLTSLGLAGGGIDMLTTFINNIGGEITSALGHAPAGSKIADAWFLETAGRVPFNVWKGSKTAEELAAYEEAENQG